MLEFLLSTATLVGSANIAPDVMKYDILTNDNQIVVVYEDTKTGETFTH